MEKADRFNEGKPKWSLVDFASLEDMVKVLEYDAEKDAPHNWKKGLPVTEVIDSLLRHTFSLLAGEDRDEESNLSHIGHIQCNAMFLSYILKHRPEFDDRGVGGLKDQIEKARNYDELDIEQIKGTLKNVKSPYKTISDQDDHDYIARKDGEIGYFSLCLVNRGLSQGIPCASSSVAKSLSKMYVEEKYGEGMEGFDWGEPAYEVQKFFTWVRGYLGIPK